MGLLSNDLVQEFGPQNQSIIDLFDGTSEVQDVNTDTDEGIDITDEFGNIYNLTSEYDDGEMTITITDLDTENSVERYVDEDSLIFEYGLKAQE